MLMAAIEFEEPEFAADLLYLIQMGLVDPNEEFNVYGDKWNLVDRAVSGEYIKNNILGFDLVDLYSVRLDVDSWEVIGAKTIEQARGYFMNRYGFLPKIIKMDKSKWLKEFYFEDMKTYKSLQEIRKESNKFPRHLLYVQPNNAIIYKDVKSFVNKIIQREWGKK